MKKVGRDRTDPLRYIYSFILDDRNFEVSMLPRPKEAYIKEQQEGGEKRNPATHITGRLFIRDSSARDAGN